MKGNVLSLGSTGRVTRGVKDLEESVLQETGFRQGVYLISDKTDVVEARQCEWKNGCIERARVYQSRIVAVLSSEGDEIGIGKINPEIRQTLESTNQDIVLCLAHLIEGINSETLGEAAKHAQERSAIGVDEKVKM